MMETDPFFWIGDPDPPLVIPLAFVSHYKSNQVTTLK